MPVLARHSALIPLFLFALPFPGGAQAPPSVRAPVYAESVEVEVVNVEVIVTDPDGRPVTGLTQDDFELLADREPVAITYFSGPAATASGPDSGSAPPEFVPAGPGAARAATETVRPTLVFYLDSIDLRPGPRNDALARLRLLAEDRVRAGQRVMVALADNGLRVLLPPSQDLRAVTLAFDRAASSSPAGGADVQRKRTLMNEIMGTSAADEFGQAQAESLLLELQSFARESADRRRAALGTFTEMLAALSGIEGPKLVFHLSGGFASNPAGALFQAWESRFGGIVGGDADRYRQGLDSEARKVQTELVRATRMAQASRAVIFAVDASDRLPSETGADNAGNAPIDAPPPGGSEGVEASAHLASLAERSGGERLIAGPGLIGALSEVTTAIASTYSLGFSPAGAADDRFHPLKVRVKRQGVRVRHREGFRRRTSADLLADAAVAAATFGSAANPLAAHLQVAYGKTMKDRLRPVRVRTKVPFQGLSLVPQGSNLGGKLLIELAVRDPEGRIVRFERREHSYQFPASRLAQALKGVLAYDLELHLAPGEQRLAIAVLDTVGGIRSTAVTELRVPGAP